MDSIASSQLWVGFMATVVVLITIDLNVTRFRGGTSPRSAAIWTGVWVSVSLAFAVYLFFQHGGATVAFPFLTAWVVEYALSVDNLFVFLVVFGYFKVPTKAQHRLLYWGVMGAFVMRGSLIFAGTALVHRFTWLLYLFGVFLLLTAWKLLFSGGADDDVDPEKNKVLQLARRVLPVSAARADAAFTVREEGRFKFTPLFLVLIVIETTDLLFALDSIPAVLGISQDPFIVFSSNVCAILGLRSLFFVVESLMAKFHYLTIGLGIILGFVGLKLIGETAFADALHHHEGLMIAGSLLFIVVTLAVSIIASVMRPKPSPESTPKVGSSSPT